MAEWLSHTRDTVRSSSVGSSQPRVGDVGHLQLTRHRSHSETTNNSSCFSCPDLSEVRRDGPLRQRSPNEPQLHIKLKATNSLSEKNQYPAISPTLPNQANVETYSRHSYSSNSSRPSSGATDRCSSRGSAATNNSGAGIRKLSSVSSCRSSSEVDYISFDEVLDLSKVVPEIRIDVSPTGSMKVPYKDQNVAEVLDFLFLGDIEAANREPLLCRLSIDYMVDLSNLTPQQMRRRVKLKDCPCLCPSERKHSPIRLTILIDEAFTEDVEQYFEEINTLIEGARKTGNKVLVFCVNGHTVSPTLVIQYLMKTLNWTLNQAFNFVNSRQEGIQIPSGFQRALVKLERRLMPQARTSSSTVDGFHSESPSDQARYGRRPLAWT